MVDAGVTAKELVAVFGRLRGHWRGVFESLPESASERESVVREVREDLSAVTTAERVSDEAAAFVETAFRARLGELGVDPAGLPEAVSEVARSLRNAFENLVRSLQQMESGDDILPETGREMRRSAAQAVAFFHELRTLDAEEQDTTAPRGPGRNIDPPAGPKPLGTPRKGTVPAGRRGEGPTGPSGQDRGADRDGKEAGGGHGDDDEAPGDEARRSGPPGGADGAASPPGSRDAVLRRLTQSYDGRRKMIRDDTEVPPPAVEAVEFLLRLGAG